LLLNQRGYYFAYTEQTITINQSKEEVKNSPEYDSSQPINDSYEHSLNDYYENKIIIMEILQEAEVFEKAKMSNMSNSDRVAASREAKRLVLNIQNL
jgi:hypothetical protein